MQNFVQIINDKNYSNEVKKLSRFVVFFKKSLQKKLIFGINEPKIIQNLLNSTPHILWKLMIQMKY